MINRRRYPAIFFVALLILTLFSSPIVYADEIPSPTRDFFVNDYANVINSEVEREIIQIGIALEDKTKAQVVVVTVEGIGDRTLEDYTIDLFRQWGIGGKDEDNGVLIFLDVGGGFSRIDVGYGLEGALPDGKTGRIRDEFMLPYYSNGDYSEGIRQGYYTIVNEIYKEYGIDETEFVGHGSTGGEVEGDGQGEGPSPLFILILFAIIVPLILLDFKLTGGAITYMILHSLLRGSGRGGPSGRGGGGRSGGGGSAGGGGSSGRF